MIVRIVKMHFKADQIDNFKTMFDEIKDSIKQQPGCSVLELYQDIEDDTVFFTYSLWDDESDLNNYRKSALFKEIWPTTKAMFAKDPEATSVNKIHSLG